MFPGTNDAIHRDPIIKEFKNIATRHPNNLVTNLMKAREIE